MAICVVFLANNERKQAHICIQDSSEIGALAAPSRHFRRMNKAKRQFSSVEGGDQSIRHRVAWNELLGDPSRGICLRLEETRSDHIQCEFIELSPI
ncbi:hypothetical protein HFO74_26315 [Rhizobium laguerreae]|uniref:Uncharacterized protein n=1 Tax=Rhizobium laguerreae TaxID=1076926 RepID=A0AB35FJG1_9HYPH|nr:hypothetical protein [Rhizobium laguerreae]MBY3066889.1 hypothetical protein [Rhizobium laguerreae]